MVYATGSLGELGIAPGHTPLLIIEISVSTSMGRAPELPLQSVFALINIIINGYVIKHATVEKM